MNFNTRAFVLFFIFLFSACFVMADMGKSHWEILAQPGVSLPGGNNNDLENESFSTQVALERQFRPNMSFGIEYGKDYGHRLKGVLFVDIDHDGLTEALKAQSDNDVQLTRTGLYLKIGNVRDWGTWQTRWVRRFFVFGCGIYQYSVDSGEYRLSGQSSTGVSWDGTTYPILEKSTQHFGVNIGTGIEVSIFTRCIMGFDIRFHQYFQSGDDSQYWIPSMSFGYIF